MSRLSLVGIGLCAIFVFAVLVQGAPRSLDNAAVHSGGPARQEGAPLATAAGITGTVATATPSALGAARPLALIVPDSELVNGPTLVSFDAAKFIADQGGYLARYNERVGDEVLTGAQIVSRVADSFSVGPRVLMAFVEMHSHWVTDPEPAERSFAVDEPLPGLWAGLNALAADLNGAYYRYRHQSLRVITLSDQTTVAVDAANAGSFAVLAVLGRRSDAKTWPGLEAPSRFAVAWTALFGDPYFFAVTETLPAELPPETLRLPFAPAELWYFVRGPHSPWGPGTPRAAVDFAPGPVHFAGCEPSLSWVTAAAPGSVVASRPEGVLVDLDGDDFAGSGWVHVYAHLMAVDRVEVGKHVDAGDRLGHPSCEGGVGGQTRLTFARRFNGEWVAADQPGALLQFDSWFAAPGAAEGDGRLLSAAGDPDRVATAAKRDAVNGIVAK